MYTYVLLSSAVKQKCSSRSVHSIAVKRCGRLGRRHRRRSGVRDLSEISATPNGQALAQGLALVASALKITIIVLVSVAVNTSTHVRISMQAG